MTNVRSATKDQTSVIKKPKKLTLEESLEFLNEDEYCEVTPESIRLRKQILNKNEREKASKKKKKLNNFSTNKHLNQLCSFYYENSWFF